MPVDQLVWTSVRRHVDPQDDELVPQRTLAELLSLDDLRFARFRDDLFDSSLLAYGRALRSMLHALTDAWLAASRFLLDAWIAWAARRLHYRLKLNPVSSGPLGLRYPLGAVFDELGDSDPQTAAFEVRALPALAGLQPYRRLPGACVEIAFAQANQVKDALIRATYTDTIWVRLETLAELCAAFYASFVQRGLPHWLYAELAEHRPWLALNLGDRECC